MELLNFMNAHPDWRELLAAAPYHLDIRSDEIDGIHYFLLKYNQIMSDMGLREVQEARGSIFRQNNKGTWICVCHPFDKFFNYGEKYSAVNSIDWNTASVQQKVDGSLIKIWWDYDGWIISTNGTIDAYKAECGDTTYGKLVEEVIDRIPNFFEMLDRDYTYMFELTSPYNRIVVRYEGTNLWYLGRRNISNQNEDNEPLMINGILHPEVYLHHSLSECVAAAHEMGDDEEGYVVCDANFNRIKIKGDEYLALHKMRGNGPLTVLRVVEMYQQGTLDDFIAYYPEFKDFTDDVIERIRYYIEVCETAFKVVNSVVGAMGERRDFAMYANTYMPIVRSYLYARLDEKVKDGSDYLMNMRARTLASYIMAEMETTKIGAEEDEQSNRRFNFKNSIN